MNAKNKRIFMQNKYAFLVSCATEGFYPLQSTDSRLAADSNRWPLDLEPAVAYSCGPFGLLPVTFTLSSFEQELPPALLRASIGLRALNTAS